MNEILEKIFGMNEETRRRTVESIILYVFMVFTTFHLPVPGEEWQEIIVKLVLCLLEAFELFYEQHYKNNDHTEIAAEHTGEMRQEKLEQDPDYVGERFYTEDPDGADIDELDNYVEEETEDDEEEGEVIEDE